jgi:hypothetical protein
VAETASHLSWRLKSFKILKVLPFCENLITTSPQNADEAINNQTKHGGTVFDAIPILRMNQLNSS